jgi:hypothetical protein
MKLDSATCDNREYFGENLKERVYLKDLGIYGRMIKYY